MKSEELVMGRHYQYTSSYIEKSMKPINENGWKVFNLLGRKQLAETDYIYQEYNKTTNKYKFKLVGLITGIVSHDEEFLENLQEKPE